MADKTIISSGLCHLFMTVFLFNFANFMVVPAITDVSMAALCPGEDECSLAIYLTGVQQAVTSLFVYLYVYLINLHALLCYEIHKLIKIKKNIIFFWMFFMWLFLAFFVKIHGNIEMKYLFCTFTIGRSIFFFYSKYHQI